MQEAKLLCRNTKYASLVPSVRSSSTYTQMNLLVLISGRGDLTGTCNLRVGQRDTTPGLMICPLAGEWFHTNILLWLFCPPRGPAYMIVAWPCATKAGAAAGLSPWQDPDSCPPAWHQPAEPSSISPWGEKTSQPLYLSRTQRRERQNDPCQQRTAVFGDRLNSWHGPKFLGAYAV